MKKENLDMKGTYEEIVEYIYKNIDVTEPVEFNFTRIIKTNAKQRRSKQFKNIYEYEVEGTIKLNDNKHKENLFKKVCLPTMNFGYTQEYMNMMGVD